MLIIWSENGDIKLHIKTDLNCKKQVLKKTGSKVIVSLSKYQFLLCAFLHLKKQKQKNKWACEPGVGVLTRDPCIWETEAVRSQVWGQTGLNSEFLYHKIYSSYVCSSMSFTALPSTPDIVRGQFSILLFTQQNFSPFLTAELAPASKMQQTQLISPPDKCTSLFWTFPVTMQRHEAILSRLLCVHCLSVEFSLFQRSHISTLVQVGTERVEPSSLEHHKPVFTSSHLPFISLGDEAL